MIDTGELAAAIIEPGVAHATGYPLFTILGYLFMQLPLADWFGMTLIRQANWFALLTTAAGVAMVAQVALLLIRRSFPRLSPWSGYAASVMGALVFGGHRVVWFQSVSIEVYGLHILMLGLVLWALLLAWQQQELKPWLLVAVALAFSFANHVSTIMLTPVIVYIFLNTWGFKVQGFRVLGFMLVLFFVLIGLLYSYLFIASSRAPLTNWGFIRDWASFKYHITGQQFSTWVFAKGAAGKQFKVFIKSLLDFGGLAGILVLLASLVVLIAKGRTVAIVIGLAFMGCLLWAINYDIHDIESYFLLCYLSIAIMVGWAIAYILTLEKPFKYAIVGLLGLGLGTTLILGIKKNDYSSDYLFDAYAHDVLLPAKPNALILSKQWDHWVASSQYFQRGAGMRPDIMVIDKELLRRIWYLNYLEEKAGKYLTELGPLVTKFKIDLAPFEQGKPYDGNNLQAGYSAMISGLATTNYRKVAVYITPEMILDELPKGELKIPADIELVPMGLYLQALPADGVYKPSQWPTHLDRLFDKPVLQPTMYHKQATSIASIAIMWRAQYELRHQHQDLAKKWLALAKKVDPNIQPSPELAGLQL